MRATWKEFQSFLKFDGVGRGPDPKFNLVSLHLFPLSFFNSPTTSPTRSCSREINIMASQEITPADRIRELSAINADVAVMLESAGKAVNALTNNPTSRSSNGEDVEMAEGEKTASIEERKATFTEHSKAYYTTLQAIIARLRRQAYALEEAGILAADSTALSSGAQQTQGFDSGGAQRGQGTAAPARDPKKITNSGLGTLDVGWLNSRGNKVGVEKENELVEEAKKLLEETLSQDVAAKNGSAT